MWYRQRTTGVYKQETSGLQLHPNHNNDDIQSFLQKKVPCKQNIVCRSGVRKFRITINTGLDLAINVHLNNGNIIIIKQCSGGIYYFNTTDTEHNIINIQVTAYILRNTVEINKAYFHQHETK